METPGELGVQGVVGCDGVRFLPGVAGVGQKIGHGVLAAFEVLAGEAV
jgi:hypothetical protein